LGSAAAGWDFRAYYAAARTIQHGANLYELASPTVPFYLYPPTLAALLAPLSPLSLPDATLLWLVIQHLALLGAGAGILRLLARGVRSGPGGWAGPGGLYLGGLIFLWGTGVPLREEIYLGQVNSLVLLLIVGGLLLAGVGAGPPGRGATWGAAGCL